MTEFETLNCAEGDGCIACETCKRQVPSAIQELGLDSVALYEKYTHVTVEYLYNAVNNECLDCFKGSNLWQLIDSNITNKRMYARKNGKIYLL